MTTPPATPRCERCQALLPAGKDSGHCPRCLLELAMAPARGATPTDQQDGGAAAPAIDVLQPLFPGYELQVLLGRGGMGAVYRARHQKLDRLVALKILLPDLVGDPAFAERFEREARTLAMLDHPGIVGIHDFGRAGEFFYLVMEFVDGANLRELLTQGRLSSRDVLAFVPQLCDALQYAHDRRVVHRDIKPENILIDQDGRVHIADFGLAKLLGQEDAGIGLTRTHQALGTPHYMAPKQIAAGSVDHRADLYSLGVVVYEMLTGSLPIGRFELPSAKSADARAFDPVVLRSLENDPARRYQQARDVKGEVESAANRPAPTRPSPVTATNSVTRKQPRSLWRTWIATGLVWIASLAPWVKLSSPGNAMPQPAEFGLNTRFSSYAGNAWHTTFLDVPCSFMLGLAVLVSVLATLRAFGKNPPLVARLVATAAGTAFCALALLSAGNEPDVHAGAGMLTTFSIFAVWCARIAYELYADPEVARRRRQRAAARRSRAAS